MISMELYKGKIDKHMGQKGILSELIEEDRGAFEENNSNMDLL